MDIYFIQYRGFVSHVAIIVLVAVLNMAFVEINRRGSVEMSRVPCIRRLFLDPFNGLFWLLGHRVSYFRPNRHSHFYDEKTRSNFAAKRCKDTLIYTWHKSACIRYILICYKSELHSYDTFHRRHLCCSRPAVLVPHLNVLWSCICLRSSLMIQYFTDVGNITRFPQ